MAFDLAPPQFAIRDIPGRRMPEPIVTHVRNPKDVAAICRKAADLIIERGHAKWVEVVTGGTYYKLENWNYEPYDFKQHRIGSMCLYGALRVASIFRQEAGAHFADYLPVMGLMREQPNIRSRTCSDGVAFNNHPDTTQEEVVAFLHMRANELEAMV